MDPLPAIAVAAPARPLSQIEPVSLAARTVMSLGTSMTNVTMHGSRAEQLYPTVSVPPETVLVMSGGADEYVASAITSTPGWFLPMTVMSPILPSTTSVPTSAVTLYQ
jgi:hypothetical protein